MNTTPLWPWLTIIGLGFWHGLNPAMGWLFAVALGLQRKSRRAMFQAFWPIGLGHALAIILVVVPAVWLGTVLPLKWVRLGGGILLVGVGTCKLVRLRHPTWVGMDVGFADLVLWSALMATVHGAGLMLVPVLLGAPAVFCGSSRSGATCFLPAVAGAASLEAVILHSLAYLAVTALVAWLVYDFVGLSVLRRSWFNVDFLWSIALIAAGATLFVA